MRVAQRRVRPRRRKLAEDTGMCHSDVEDLGHGSAYFVMLLLKGTDDGVRMLTCIVGDLHM